MSVRTFFLSWCLLICLCCLLHFLSLTSFFLTLLFSCCFLSFFLSFCSPQLSLSACHSLHIPISCQPLLTVPLCSLSLPAFPSLWTLLRRHDLRCLPSSLLSLFTLVYRTNHRNSEDECRAAKIAKKNYISLKVLSRFGSAVVCELCGVSSLKLSRRSLMEMS